ncbi:MAG: Cupin 2, conserved barrel [Solirubrobacterales bacterium]|jgi:quercetin dioxygenase-like cupin family protein|nr:Cupin 2, conserved barrel [Solirubrobacterales bacterium]
MSATEAYRSLVNSATGETIQFMAQPPGEGEDVVRFNWQSKPGGEITEHIHPVQEERFNITAGQAHFVLDGETRVLGPGETITVAAGTRHSEENRGSTEVSGTVELRPALKTREMHEAFAGLAAEGKTTSRGAPKNPLQLGATIWHFRHESRATAPPIWIQNAMLPPLAALARLFGVSAYNDRWDSRTGNTQSS